MTEQQFSNINPSAIPNGINIPSNGHALMYVVRGIPTTGAQRILGISIPYTSLNGVNVYQSTFNTTRIIFDIPTLGTYNTPGPVEKIDMEVLAIVRRPSWVYFKLNPETITDVHSPTGNCFESFVTFPQTGTGYNQIDLFCSSDFIFDPFIEGSFLNNDSNPLQGNATNLRGSSKYKRVNRYEDAIIPTNIDAIRAGTAATASIQDSNYEIAGWTNGRYRGSKLNSRTITKGTSTIYEHPAQSFRGFKGVVYEGTNTGEAQKILDTFVSSSTVQEVTYEPIHWRNTDDYNTQVGVDVVLQVPNDVVQQSDVLYKEDGNRFVPLASKSIYSADAKKVFITDERGYVTSIKT